MDVEELKKTHVILPHYRAEAWSQRAVPFLREIAQNSEQAQDVYKELFSPLTSRHKKTHALLTSLLPFIASRALEVEVLFPSPLPLLLSSVDREEETHTQAHAQIVLTQRQCLCILSLSFFGILEPQTAIRANHLCIHELLVQRLPNFQDKLACLALYFNTLKLEMATQAGEASTTTDAGEDLSLSWQGSLVSFTRASIRAHDVSTRSYWETTLAATSLSPFVVRDQTEAKIEYEPNAMHADFANEVIGGGTLGYGCVQEEILFVVTPECLVSLLFCDIMATNEAILIRGARRFCEYSGYGNSFKCAGIYNDDELFPVDASTGYRERRIVAFDAVQYGFSNPPNLQYRDENILRDLVKCTAAVGKWPCEEVLVEAATVGEAAEGGGGGGAAAEGGGGGEEKEAPPAATSVFDTTSVDAGQSAVISCRAFASGNWGCGAFLGDPQFKLVLQWLACSACDRPLTYFLFADPRMVRTRELVQAVVKNRTTSGVPVSAGLLAKWLFEFKHFAISASSTAQSSNPFAKSAVDFFEYVFEKLRVRSSSSSDDV